MEVATQLSLHFQGGKCVSWKKQKNHFRQIFTKMIAMSGHLILVTDDLENVSQGQNVHKLLTFGKGEYFFKKNLLPKSSVADGNR